MEKEQSSASGAVTPEPILAAERARWNRCLLDPTWRKNRFNPKPNKLLVDTLEGRMPGNALDINMGEGRNALYLAQRGWQVTGVDIAEQALAYAQQQAEELGVSLTLVNQDVQTFNWGCNLWDALLLMYADDVAHAEQAYAALKPGGIVVFENFHAEVNQVWQGKLPHKVGFETDELKACYAHQGFRILRYEEPVAVADFTLETQRLVRMVAQKP
ncbi:class I SAM-dependent methyltransferase [Hymenobacter tenuis]